MYVGMVSRGRTMVLPGRMRWVTAGTSFVIDETRIGGFGYARASRPKLTTHRTAKEDTTLNNILYIISRCLWNHNGVLCS